PDSVRSLHSSVSSQTLLPARSHIQAADRWALFCSMPVISCRGRSIASVTTTIIRRCAATRTCSDSKAAMMATVIWDSPLLSAYCLSAETCLMRQLTVVIDRTCLFRLFDKNARIACAVLPRAAAKLPLLRFSAEIVSRSSIFNSSCLETSKNLNQHLTVQFY